MTPLHRIVECLWEDAHQSSAQTTLDELDDAMLVCTVGYLARENADAVWIAAEAIDGGDVRTTTRIPRALVREIRELGRKRESRKRKMAKTPEEVT